jgi:hypothetical protein
MNAENDLLLPEWPESLHHVDIVQAGFILDFWSACRVTPVDFLDIGRMLRIAAKQLFNSHDAAATRRWQTLFQPALSTDPVARRKFQKPAPAFVITIPVTQERLITAGDRLELEVLFIGTGIAYLHDFLNSLSQLGNLGLVAGEGCFEVTEVYIRQSGQPAVPAWQQAEPVDALSCSVQPLAWLLQLQRVTSHVKISYVTPTRLMVDGKPLRRPSFSQVFPFMLRRVTSMLYAHCGIEVIDDPAQLLERVGELESCDKHLSWQDWRVISAQQGVMVGGFVGDMLLSGRALEELYWVLAVAALLGIGKGATYGAGHFTLTS